MPYVEPQHRSGNEKATSTDSSAANRSAGGTGYASQAAALKPSARTTDPPKKEGWGDWFDRKRTEASTWVGETTTGAVDWAKETASEVRDFTQEKADAAREAWDTASNTDYSVDRTGMGVAMRVRDLQKMLPPEAAAQLNFDEKHLDDRISARYEYGTDYVTLTAPSLSLAGLNVQGFRSGAASATDVTVVVTNPGGKLPFVQEGWQDSGNLLMNLSVGVAKADAVRYGEGPNELSANSLEVHGLKVTGTAPTSRVLGTGAGVASGGFSVDRAIVRGASLAGVSAGEVDVSGAEANWREDTGQLSAGAKSVKVNEVASDGMTLGSGQATNVAANQNGALGNVSASDVSMADLNLGEKSHIGAASLTGLNANFDRAAKTADAEAAGLSADDLQFGSTSLQSVRGQGVSVGAEQSGRGHSKMTVAARNATAKGLKVDDDVSIDNIATSNVNFSNDSGARTQSASASALKAGGVSGDGFAAGNLASTNAAYSLDRQSGNLGVSASTVDATNLTGGPVSAAKGSVTGLDYRNNINTSAGATRVDAMTLEKLTSEHGTAATASADKLEVRHSENGIGVSADRLGATSLASQYGGATSLNLQGLNVDSAKTKGVRKSDATLDGLNATGLDVSGMQAKTLDAQKLAVSGQGSEYSGQLAGLQGSSLSYGEMASVDKATLSRLGFDHGAGGTTATVGQAGLTDTRVQKSGMALQIADAQLQGASAQFGENRGYGLDKGTAEGIKGSWDGTGGPPMQIPGVDFSKHQLDASIGLRAGTLNLGGAREMVTDAGKLVDNADVRMSMPLTAADYGMVEVEKNTVLNGQMQVNNGQLVPGKTGVSMSKGLDGPLWTEVNGVQLEADRKGRGKVRADVGGFFDQNISKQVMGSLGQKANRVPLSVAELSRLGGNQLDSGKSKGQVTLGQENASDNQIQLRSNAQGAVASFVRLLVSSVNVQSGSTSTSAGRTAVNGASIQTKGTPNKPDNVTGSIQSLEIEQLRSTATD